MNGYMLDSSIKGDRPTEAEHSADEQRVIALGGWATPAFATSGLRLAVMAR